MSLMTALSGASSLLLLLIPRKYEAGEQEESLVVTCCETELCVSEEMTYTRHFSPLHNLSLPTCLPAGETLTSPRTTSHCPARKSSLI